MKRSIHRLSARTVETKRKPGLYCDGGGLNMQIGPSGSKAWLFRFMLRGRAREMGLGPINARSLQEARDEAAACRKLLLHGIDPIEAREGKDAAARLAAASALTFRECARAYLEAHRAGWKSAKHADQWRNTIATYADPVLGALPVAGVDTALVMRVLEPIWRETTETASRLRGRIESVLDWAAVRGYRSGENPARWRGHLDKLLPKRSKVQGVKHHAALPYAEVAVFVTELQARRGAAARALEFTILTAARTQEVIGAKWAEIDLARKTWTIPASRMKAGSEHRVPLSDGAVKIIGQMQQVRQSDYVFPGDREDEPLANAAMHALLRRRMARADLTVHGFRSTFRDWTAEVSNFPRELAEAALAHVLSDKTEAAYQRGDLCEKRRNLMAAWSDYVSRQPGAAKVRQLSRASA